MILAPDVAFFDDSSMPASARTAEPPQTLRTWTDDYSNLLRIIR